MCAGGHCVDGVCCNTACDGPCVGCASLETLGSCTPHGEGSDPEDDCPLCSVCSGDLPVGGDGRASECVPVVEGEDPEEDCDREERATCGRDGRCDGEGRCRLWAEGTVCAAPECDGEAGLATTAATCDGLGACQEGESAPCPDGRCHATTGRCLDSCVAGCSAEERCLAGACRPKLDQGQPCALPADCLGGHCVEGLCCDQACSEPCRSCRVGGREGSCQPWPDGTDPRRSCPICQVCDGQGGCRPVEAGEDPMQDCAQQDPESCGLEGGCDGKGGCRFWGFLVPCRSEGAGDPARWPADFCDGSSSCRPSDEVDCDEGFGCAENRAACLKVCSSNSDCLGTHYCVPPRCVPREALGQSCEAGYHCQSGHCADGRCCDKACEGLCESCANDQGTCEPLPSGEDLHRECEICHVCDGEGACRAAGAGTDPKSECAQQAPHLCGAEGTCDGAGACRLWAEGTWCGARGCEGAAMKLAATCDGEGSCGHGQAVSCEPYACRDAACLTSCAVDSHCAEGRYCDNTSCVPKLEAGAACTVARACASGSCAGGYCCDTRCTGPCVSCDQSGTVGTCTPHEAGSDPERECGPCRVCSGSFAPDPSQGSECRPVAAGADPKSDCRRHPASSCILDGACDGQGGCRLHAAGTTCRPASCVGTTRTEPSLCDGSGACQAGASVSCHPFACDDDTCRSACTEDGHCARYHHCSEGQCLPSRKAAGEACEAGTDCMSDHCVDGVCCAEACDGPCRSCNQPGSAGACTPYPADSDPDAECEAICSSCDGSGACTATSAGLDPEEECAEEPTSTCGADGSCDGAGGCRLWALGTECASQTCSGGVVSSADQCDGNGTCADGGESSCDDAEECTNDRCDDAGVDCIFEPVADGTDCDAGGGPGTGTCAGGACNPL